MILIDFQERRNCLVSLFAKKTDGEFLGRLKAALLNAEQSKLDNDFLKP